MMEVQVFLLARQIKQMAQNRFDGAQLGIYRIVPRAGASVYPHILTLPYFLLLRRPTEGENMSLSLNFNLIDEDGATVYSPESADAVFAGAERFHPMTGEMELRFPAPGKFRLDIAAVGGLMFRVYSYDIELAAAP